MNTTIHTICDEMKKAQMDAMIISDPVSIDYLIDYYTQPGERLFALILTQSGQMTLILNQLFPSRSGDQRVSVISYHDGDPILEQITLILDQGTIGIDKNWPSHFLIDLMKLKPDFNFVQGSPIIDRIRSIKTNEEVALLRQASHRNDQVMKELIDHLAANRTEEEMVEYLGHLYEKYECQGFSFEPIIAYGPNGADPHHTTDKSIPQLGQSIVLDIGSRYNGYCSDMTRTVFWGKASPEYKTIYKTVLNANLAAIEHVHPGVSFASIDQAARSIIEAAGYGPYFTHRTGHSIGREVHEAGDVGPDNHQLVEVGQVFSIEPGIYLPGKMGVRIEDLVVVTHDGCEVLNQANKELIEINK